MTHSSKDCELQNDSWDGSSSTANSNLMDGEDEDVLSSLLSTHSFTQNDASPYMLDNNSISVILHPLGEPCDVSNAHQFRHVVCGVINTENTWMPPATGTPHLQNGGSSAECDSTNKHVDVQPNTHHQANSNSSSFGRLAAKKSHEHDLYRRTFRNQSSLTRHGQTHSVAKSYVCDMCDRAYSNLRSLQEHKRRHSGTDLYICDICSKAFTRSKSLERHERTHSGVKPHTCDICDKSFADLRWLQRHKRLHDERGDRRLDDVTDTLICDICTKAFTGYVELNIHKLVHSGVRLRVCDVSN